MSGGTRGSGQGVGCVETKYDQRGKSVEIIGLNSPSADLHGKLTGELSSH
ncbi:hypothetical protein LUR56_03605 [Streptomyces sp. MT29]|nr:hypothetical protein [Streptomyces sp. MT29]